MLREAMDGVDFLQQRRRSILKPGVRWCGFGDRRLGRKFTWRDESRGRSDRHHLLSISLTPSRRRMFNRAIYLAKSSLVRSGCSCIIVDMTVPHFE